MCACMCVCTCEHVWRLTHVSKATITGVHVTMIDSSGREECYHVGPMGDR